MSTRPFTSFLTITAAAIAAGALTAGCAAEEPRVQHTDALQSRNVARSTSTFKGLSDGHRANDSTVAAGEHTTNYTVAFLPASAASHPTRELMR